MWIAFPTVLRSSSPNMAATLAALRAAFQSNLKEIGPSTGDAEAAIHRTPWADGSGSAQ
jgi:hypothetical protein